MSEMNLNANAMGEEGFAMLGGMGHENMGEGSGSNDLQGKGSQSGLNPANLAEGGRRRRRRSSRKSRKARKSRKGRKVRKTRRNTNKNNSRRNRRNRRTHH